MMWLEVMRHRYIGMQGGKHCQMVRFFKCFEDRQSLMSKHRTAVTFDKSLGGSHSAHFSHECKCTGHEEKTFVSFKASFEIYKNNTDLFIGKYNYLGFGYNPRSWFQGKDIDNHC